MLSTRCHFVRNTWPAFGIVTLLSKKLINVFVTLENIDYYSGSVKASCPNFASNYMQI